MASVEVTCADGKPLAALANLIQQRSRWLNETAEQACAACMIDVLVSLRALTKVANPKKKEIVVEETALSPSYTTVAKGTFRFCLRQGKARYVPKANERVVKTNTVAQNLKGSNVYRWNSYKRIYLIVAISKQDAIDWAFAQTQKRAKKYKGLARIVFSILMKKTGTKTSQSIDNAQAAKKAPTVSTVIKRANGNQYTLEAHDLLDYAKLALKGGDNSINLALSKASNKIASVINNKCKDLLSFNKIQTPFPELRNSKTK